MKEVKKYLIKYKDGKKEVHYDGPFQPGDVALCGHDLMGDSHKSFGGWDAGVETVKPVDCEACKRVVEQVKDILKKSKQTA